MLVPFVSDRLLSRTGSADDIGVWYSHSVCRSVGVLMDCLAQESGVTSVAEHDVHHLVWISEVYRISLGLERSMGDVA